jgi:hypothetical protein
MTLTPDRLATGQRISVAQSARWPTTKYFVLFYAPSDRLISQFNQKSIGCSSSSSMRYAQQLASTSTAAVFD